MSNDARRGKRLFAGFIAAVMALSVAPLVGFTGVAGANEHLEAADPIGPGNFCEDVPMQEPFTDVQETDPSYEEIVCLVATEVTTGVTATTYEPNSFVTRRQMALFLTRVAAEADRLEIGDNIEELPAPAANEFPDVEDEEQFIQDAISQIAQAQIAEGFEDGNYRPAAPVSRRQMAAFIDRLYTYLTGDELPASDDYFADDDEDSAEAQASTNAVAEAGIFIGNADGTFGPAQEITRRQMANVLTRTFEVLFENGEIEQWRDADAPPASNQSFAVTPAEGATVEEGATQQFTVSGITSDTVDIGLADCADVTVQDGVVTFDDSVTTADNNAFDFAAVPEADITVINGIDVTDGDYFSGIGATDGEVTFTVEMLTRGCVVAVVFDDADNDDALDLDADDLPTEAFAVTGEFDIIPAEAAEGDAVDGLVVAVGDDYAVINDTAGTETGEVTVFFRDGDTYRILSGAFCTATTEATFLENLSVDDNLATVIDTAGTAGPYTQAGANEYCLEDLAPLGPTDVAAAQGTPADTTIDVTWTASGTASVDSYNVYVNDEACTATTADELTLLDSTTELAYEATGLTPETTYCFVVTAVDGEDESAVTVGTVVDATDNTDEATTAASIVAPTIESASLTTDSPITGVADSGDVWTLVFSEDMAAATATDGAFLLTDADGDTVLVACGSLAADATDGITDATCSLADSEVLAGGGDTDGNTTDALVITLDEDAEDRNFAGDGDILYPVTITDATDVTDDDDGAEVDLAASADVTIG